MATHIALLRGVNVAGRSLPMAQLRSTLSEHGFDGVRTYIQSGNVLFDSGAPSDDIAGVISGLIVETFDLTVPVIVLTTAELRSAVDANPFVHQATKDPKRVHAVFYPNMGDADFIAAVGRCQERAHHRSSPDEARVLGRVMFLSTPDGFGRSILAEELTRGGRNSPLKTGTARNWATVLRLRAMSATGSRPRGS